VRDAVAAVLAEFPILTLFVVIGLGYLLGEISFFGFRLGVAGVLFAGLAIGMVLGVLLGTLPIPLPGGHTVRLGLAGGPLLAALLLGHVERTGRISWVIPVSANLTLRQIGLLLFLAGVGTRAGYQFARTLAESGPALLAAGALAKIVLAQLPASWPVGGA